MSDRTVLKGQAIGEGESTGTLSEHQEVLGSEVETDGTDLIIGIPAYNEETGIGSVVLSAQQHTDDVIVVDDGSSDRTAEIARQAGALVIEHEKNSGKGQAMQTLFDYVKAYDFDALVVFDGDGQHAPADVPKVADPVINGDSDLVIGSRYLERDKETPFYRRFGQQILDMLTGQTARMNLTDTQSGFRAFSPEAVERLNLRTKGMGVESEMINSATKQGLEINERPISVRYRGIDGQTFNPLQHGLSVALFIIQLMRDRHPLLFFGLPGLVLIVAGTAYGLNAALIYQNTGVFLPWPAMISGIVTIIGILGVFCGLVLNQISIMIEHLEEGMA